MIKSIISIILIVSMTVCMMPSVYAQSQNKILFSEDFKGYAENEQALSTMKITNGLDGRVINDKGNKVLFARALGDDVNISVDIPASDATETVMSVRAKITGDKTTGKLFNATFAGAKVNFISIDEKGNLCLYDNTVLGGLSSNYKTITVIAKWKKKVFSVYVDKKCVADNWAMPSVVATKSPTKLEFTFDYNENAETDAYLDDIRVYEGSTLPWNMKFPTSSSNNEVLEFTPTENFDPNAVTIIKDFSYDGSSTGLMYANISTEISNYTMDDGIKVMRWYSPEEKASTSGFADISLPELATKRKYVFDLKLKVNELTGGSKVCLFDSKDTAGQWTVRGFEFGSSQNLTADQGGGSAKIPFGEWVRLSFVYNLKLGTIGIYVNGEFVSENKTVAGATPNYFRFDVISPAGSKMDVYFDWFRIYTGNELVDDSYFSQDSGVGIDASQAVEGSMSIMDNATKLNAALIGKTVFLTTNDSMYYNGKKEIISNDAEKLKKNGNVWMIPQATLERINGGRKLEYDKETNTFTIGDKTASLNYEEVNGVIYLPLTESVEKLMGKFVSYDVRDMAVISSEKSEVRTNPVIYLDRHKVFYDYDLIYRYLLFDNPTGKEILSAVKKNYPSNAHPRVYWTGEDIKYILEKADADPVWREEVQKNIDYADNILYVDMSSEFAAQGSAKQGASSRLQNYITALSTAHLLTGEAKYAKKGVELMKGFAAWADSGYKSANLTIGHWAQAMGIGFDSFYNYMNSTPEGKKDIKYLKERMVELQYADHIASYSKGITSGPTWITYQDNFVGCIGGGMMCMLLAICDEPGIEEESEYLLENVLRSLYIAAETFYPDGGYYEGLTYGDMMFENFTNALDALFSCCKTDYGIGRVPGFKEAGQYFVYLNSPTGRLNFHDDDGVYYNRFVPEYMAFRYGENYTAQMGRDSKRLADLKFSINYSLKGLYYYDKTLTDKGIKPDVSDAPLDKYISNIGTGTFRSSHADEKLTYIGYHGGYTNIPHDMLDLGEFVFASDGVMWACDLGKDDYGLPGYFQISGYNIYRKRPEGKNCLVLNPAKDVSNYFGQEVGANTELVLLDENKPKGAMAALDLTKAYSRDASKYVRGYYFGDNRRTLTVQDEVSLKDVTEAYWFMHTSATVRIVDNNHAILTKDGKSLSVEVYCNQPGFELKNMPASPLATSPVIAGQKQNTGYTKLAVHHPSAKGELVISVKLSPVSGVNAPLEYKPISEWTIPDGDLPKAPNFTGVYYDGKIMPNFVPGKTSYTVNLPYGTRYVPLITATSDKGTVEVIQAQSFSDVAIVSIKCDGFEDKVCTVRFNVSNDRPVNVVKAYSNAIPSVGVPGEKISPVSVSVRGASMGDSNLTKLADGNLSTSYTISSVNTWIEYDLGQIKNIKGVAMAFSDGDNNVYAYKILYSQDGTNFTEVYDGLATGTSSSVETLEIPSSARYVRFVGMGTTRASAKTNLTELAVY